MTRFLEELDQSNIGLFTDLYELTMCASYFENGKDESATFDLFVRNLPENRGYLVFAGLEQALLYLENLKINEKHLSYLRKQGFSEEFLKYLRDFEFTGDVWAMPEGSIVFPNEPLIRVTAPIIEAQLIETFLLNTINLQTTIATKASRVVQAAQGRPVIEFGLRREHGIDAGMKVARASYLAGCVGTSNVLAGMAYGIPIFGTMAHSFVMAYENEIDAFRAFAKTFPDKSTLLIDTFDDLKGAENAAIVGKELENDGHRLGGVRLDSGDLVNISLKVRKLLDDKGLKYVNIFASGDLDEYRIDDLLKKGAKIDSFGVGTRMGTSADRPYVDVIYKVCETETACGDFSPIMKLSEGKITLPGRKQVFRFRKENGDYAKDIIALATENFDAAPLLIPVMKKGRISLELPSLKEIQSTVKHELDKLPTEFKKTRNPAPYPVEQSKKLSELTKALTERLSNVNRP